MKIFYVWTIDENKEGDTGVIAEGFLLELYLGVFSIFWSPPTKQK